jgi:hypothetical protein
VRPQYALGCFDSAVPRLREANVAGVPKWANGQAVPAQASNGSRTIVKSI